MLIPLVAQTPKKNVNSKKTDVVEVDFRSVPREFFHFNQFSVEEHGNFVQLSLWFFDNFSGSIPVFRGRIWKNDLRVAVGGFRHYIEKIGLDSNEEPTTTRPPLWNAPPISFNMIDCASIDDFSEIVIRNFSHKAAIDSTKSNTTVTGVNHGVYASDGSVHRNLVVALISLFPSKP